MSISDGFTTSEEDLMIEMLIVSMILRQLNWSKGAACILMYSWLPAWDERLVFSRKNCKGHRKHRPLGLASRA